MKKNGQYPFQFLGYDHGVHYFLPNGSKQVRNFREDQLNKSHLLGLAPLQYWEITFASKSGARWDMATNSIIAKSHEAGVYDPDRIRGCGAWWDGDHAVLHLGDRLTIGGKESPLDVPGRYIYERTRPLNVDPTNPLDAKSARAVLRICELISWDQPISARYLAGWLAIAPICGALTWRPHVWIVGESGSGKTWIVDHIIRYILSGVNLQVSHTTTEAGLRQMLGQDARPITFDESEGSGQRGQDRIDNVLGLARQASSDTMAAIIKGSASGEAVSYRIRSCFLFSSIGYGVTAKADESRVTAMTIIKDDNTERYIKLAALVAETMTTDYVHRLVARSIHMIPVIRANARIFAAAAAKTLGSQRAGDQIGALLAGAYSLDSDDVITVERATEWIGSKDWTEQRGLTAETDQYRCYHHLMAASLRCQPKSGPCDRTVGELVDIAAARPAPTEEVISEQVALDTLGRAGIKADAEGVIISVSHAVIKRIFQDTDWSRSWGRTLLRLPGAWTSNNPIRFKGGRTRGVTIPFDKNDSEPFLQNQDPQKSEKNTQTDDQEPLFDDENDRNDSV